MELHGFDELEEVFPSAEEAEEEVEENEGSPCLHCRKLHYSGELYCNDCLSSQPCIECGEKVEVMHSIGYAGIIICSRCENRRCHRCGSGNLCEEHVKSSLHTDMVCQDCGHW